MDMQSMADVDVLLAATYDVRLVILSILIAIIASYTALDLVGRITVAQGYARQLWLSGAAIALGGGIWSTHFIALLAYNLPVAISYDFWLVLLSIVIAIIASGIALFITSREQMGQLAWLGGGTGIGLGVVSVHYTAIVAMRLEAIANYNPWLVSLSFAIAFAASISALWLTFHLKTAMTWKGFLVKIGSAILMGNAIAGMHYLGMAAVQFQPISQSHLISFDQTIDNSAIAVGVGVATMIILILGFIASLFERRLGIELAQLEAIERSKARLRSLLQNASDIIVTIAVDGTIKYVSPSIQQILGIEPSKWLNKIFFELVHPEDIPKANKFFYRTINNPSTNIIDELRLQDHYGLWKNFDVIANNGLSNPNIDGIILTYHAINTDKTNQEEVKQAHLFLNSILENLPSIILIKETKELRFSHINKTGEALLGYSQSELIGKCDLDLFPPEQAKFFINTDRESITSQKIIEIPEEIVQTRDKGSRILHTKKIPLVDQDGQAKYLLGISEDITERKLSEQAIIESTQRITNILESITDAFFALDHEWHFTYINNKCLQLFKKESSDELIGKNIWQQYPELFNNNHHQEYHRALAEQISICFEEFSTLDNTWFEVRVYPSKDGLSIYLKDISQRKKTEKILKRYQILSENSRDIVLFIGNQGQIIEANQAAVKAYGYEREELLKLKVHQLRPLKVRNLLDEQIAQAEKQNILFETIHCRKDGSEFPVEISSQGAIFANEKVVLKIIRDITERKQAEKEIKESEAAIRSLYKVTAARKLSFEQRLQGLLALGRRHFGLDMGALGQVESDRYQVVAAQMPANSSFKMAKGDIFDLQATYCNHTLGAKEPIYFESAGKSPQWCHHPVYITTKIESYIGTPVIVDGKVYGTLSFFSLKERSQIFKPADVSFLKLMAQWIGGEIERQKAQLTLSESQTRLKLINSISTGIALGMTIERVIEQTIQEIYEYFPSLRVSYSTIDSQGKLSVINSVQPAQMQTLVGLNCQFHNISKYLQEFRMSQPVIIENIADHPQIVADLSELILVTGARSILYVPLQHSQKLVGLLSFDSAVDKQWDNHEITTLTEIAEYLSLALKESYTQRKRKQALEALKESENRLKLALNAAQMEVWDWDLIENKVIWSEGVAALMGIPTACLMNTYEAYLSYVHPEDRESVNQVITKAVMAGTNYSTEHRIIQPKGKIRWIGGKGDVLRDEAGKVIRLTGMLMDITDRKMVEEEVRKALEKEKELNELKSRFVSMASHEFRTPLATIQTSSDLLKRFNQKFTDEQRHERLNKIQAEVKNMTRLLEDVLIFGKAEAGRLQFNPVSINLKEFCQGILEEIEFTSRDHYKFNFNYQGEDTTVQMDEKLLRQMLSNLLSNAVKYSREGESIDFEVICQEYQAIFQISDRGIGIPKQDQERLFEAFYRASNVTNIAGTGLGLTIIKKAVELHGGNITFKSEVGVGTTFRVDLPKNGV